MDVPKESLRCWCDLDGPVKVCRFHGDVMIVWDEVHGVRAASIRVGGCGSSLREEVAVGTWLRLQNVCFRGDGSMEIAPSSRVTVVPPPAPPSDANPPKEEDHKAIALVSPPPTRSKWKWKCQACSYTNFPSKSVCYKCDKTRKVISSVSLPPVIVPRSIPLQKELPLTEVVVATKDIPVTPLVELLSSLRPQNWKYLVECHVRSFLPSDIRHFTQQRGGSNEWCYLVQLVLVEGPVSLPVLVCDSLFFHGLPPCDLFLNNGSLQILTRKMDRLCFSTTGKVRLALQSYVPAGREERVFQVFGTILL